MYLYSYELLKETTTFLNKDKYLLIEEEISTINFSYTLDLCNNQNREVYIYSNKPFDNIFKNKQAIVFEVKDVIIFSYITGENRIYYNLLQKGTKKLLYYWLSHTFLPIILTVDDIYYILHAGAVELEGKPVLFVADSFGGKSTLTDFFIKKGHTMISDDKVATYEEDGKIFSVPSYPYHRPYRKVEDLGSFVENFATKNKPINTIFHLVKSEPTADIKISKISGIEKFKVLRYATDIDLPVNQKSKFERVTSLANKVDIYNITIPWDLDRLEEVYQAIVNFAKNKKVNQ